jgi:hypothetical protein
MILTAIDTFNGEWICNFCKMHAFLISQSLFHFSSPVNLHLVHGLKGYLLAEGKNPRLPVVVAEKNFPDEERSRLIILRAYVLSFRVRTTSLLGLASKVPRVDDAKVFV